VTNLNGESKLMKSISHECSCMILLCIKPDIFQSSSKLSGLPAASSKYLGGRRGIPGCARLKLQQLKVVNDAAECVVALIQSFNAVLANQDDQKQLSSPIG